MWTFIVTFLIHLFPYLYLFYVQSYYLIKYIYLLWILSWSVLHIQEAVQKETYGCGMWDNQCRAAANEAKLKSKPGINGFLSSWVQTNMWLDKYLLSWKTFFTYQHKQNHHWLV